MTKLLSVLVLAGLTEGALLAGPIEKDSQVFEPVAVAAPLATGGLTTYAAFMELAGPLWLRETPSATFDSVLHYALSGVPVPAGLDLLAEDMAVVPEPRPVALLGFGLAILALLGLRRRRRSHPHNL
jgi:hypothetical protein